MRMRQHAAAAVALALCATVAGAEISVSDAELDYMEALYKHFHRNPELSLYEFETAARMAEEFAAAGFEVTSEVGGTGVVGVLQNGDGPTVMIRGDMDALPVVELTGVDYASRVTTTDELGRRVPVMHACGHDIHITNLIGVARKLANMRDKLAGNGGARGAACRGAGSGRARHDRGRTVCALPPPGLQPGAARDFQPARPARRATSRNTPWPTWIRSISSFTAPAATARRRT